MPPELLRKGCWDKMYFVEFPNLEERDQIWRLQVAKHELDPKAGYTGPFRPPEEAKGPWILIADALIPGSNVGDASFSLDRRRQLQPLAAEIMPALERALQDERQWVRHLTAFQLLGL